MIQEIIDFFVNNLDWIGLFFGITGGLMIAYPTYRTKVWGFEMWVYSNVFWIAYAWTINSLAIAINYLFFLIISLAGIWTHLPLADAEKRDKAALLEIPKKI